MRRSKSQRCETRLTQNRNKERATWMYHTQLLHDMSFLPSTWKSCLDRSWCFCICVQLTQIWWYVRHGQHLQTESFQEFLKKLSAQLKKTYATGTCLCLEDDSYNSDPTSQFSRLNTYYLGLAQCYLSNSRHSVCSSTGPQKEGYYVIIISLKQPHA